MSKQIPVYLLVADETEEFGVALRYAAHLAKEQGARLAALHMVEEPEIMPWADIGRMIHYDNIEEARGVLLSACDQIREITGHIPSLYLLKTTHYDSIADIIARDTNITKFILGGDVKTKSPGPLVSYFTGKGLTKLRVPLTIVPGHWDQLEVKV